MKLSNLACAITAACLVVAVPAMAQRLPYKAVHNPQFISARAATFLHDDDRVIGVEEGKTAKAFPAAILAQHGLVEDAPPDGPIAITW